MFMKKIVLVLLVLLAGSAQAVDITIIDIVGGSQAMVEFKKVDEGELITFQIIASDGSNCDISNLPKGAIYQSNIFSWVPDAYQAGMYPISFHTSDANTITYRKIRIVVANRIFNILVVQPFEYLFMAMDPDEDDVEITITGLPTGATFTGTKYGPKLLQWTPALAQIGTHNMILTATDNPSEGLPLTDTSNLVITVATEANIPVVTNPYDYNKDDYIDEYDLSIFAPNWLDCIKLVQANCDSAYRDRILLADAPTLRLIEFFVIVNVRTDRYTTVYHTPGCRDLRRKPYYETTLGRAKEKSFIPHSKCKSHQLLSEINK